MATCAGSLEIDPANTETTPQVIPAVGNPSSPRPLPRRATAAPNRNSRPLVEPLPTPRSALGPVKLVVSAERLGSPGDPVRLAECSEPSRKAWPVAQRPYPPGSRNRFVASCYAKPNVSSMSWTGPASMAAEGPAARQSSRTIPGMSALCQGAIEATGSSRSSGMFLVGLLSWRLGGPPDRAGGAAAGSDCFAG